MVLVLWVRVIEDLLSESYEVKALVRQSSEILPLVVEQVVVGDYRFQFG